MELIHILFFFMGFVCFSVRNLDIICIEIELWLFLDLSMIDVFFFIQILLNMIQI